jgi:hypothetical protein
MTTTLRDAVEQYTRTALAIYEAKLGAPSFGVREPFPPEWQRDGQTTFIPAGRERWSNPDDRRDLVSQVGASAEYERLSDLLRADSTIGPQCFEPVGTHRLLARPNLKNVMHQWTDT